MPGRKKAPAELKADIIDVHILDIAAHLEALLRGVRELQRCALSLRGVVIDGVNGEPPDLIRGRLDRMRKECDALRAALDIAAAEAGCG